MRNPYLYISGLALCALGNIGSAGIARDLCADVERQLESASAYVRKKAALAAVHVVRKCPDLAETYAGRLRTVFKAEKNHGVMLALAALVLEVCAARPAAVPELAALVPFCCRVLRALVGAGYVAEYDVSGVCDPFLQVKLLRVLRVLGGAVLARGDARAAAHITGILAQVLNNTESARNVGNAVLYECVQTICALPVEAGLRVLAVNVLGRFLANTDNNIRSVALNTLHALVAASDDGARALQRHKQTVVACLRDADPTIRRRALALVSALADASNARALARDLLGYLVVADRQFRPTIAAKLCWLVERHAPAPLWQLDTTLRVLEVAGNDVPQEVPASLCRLVARSPQLQPYAVQRLYALLRDDGESDKKGSSNSNGNGNNNGNNDLRHTRESIVLVGLWCFGEFGDMLMGPLVPPTEESTEPRATATPAQLVDVVEAVLRDAGGAARVLQCALACLAKLATRFAGAHDAALDARIRALIARHRTSIHTDVQQRACEFDRLFAWPAVRDTVLERMPPPPADNDDDGEKEDNTASSPPQPQPQATAAAAAAAATTSVLDVLTGLPSTSTSAASEATAPAPATPTPASDVLADLFGTPSTTSTSSRPASSPAALVAAAAPRELPVYSQHGLVAVLQVARSGCEYHATARLTATAALSSIVLRVAVPRWLRLELAPASGSTLAPASPAITQRIHITDTSNGSVCVVLFVVHFDRCCLFHSLLCSFPFLSFSKQNPVLLRVRLTFQTAAGQSIDDIVELAVPSDL